MSPNAAFYVILITKIQLRLTRFFFSFKYIFLVPITSKKQSKRGITVLVFFNFLAKRQQRGNSGFKSAFYARGLGRILSPKPFSRGEFKTIKTIKRVVTCFQVTGENHHQL